MKYINNDNTRNMICIRAGIDDQKLRRIIVCSNELVDFDVADRIMCAINRPDVFTNGEVAIIHD